MVVVKVRKLLGELPICTAGKLFKFIAVDSCCWPYWQSSFGSLQKCSGITKPTVGTKQHRAKQFLRFASHAMTCTLPQPLHSWHAFPKSLEDIEYPLASVRLFAKYC